MVSGEGETVPFPRSIFSKGATEVLNMRLTAWLWFYCSFVCPGVVEPAGGHDARNRENHNSLESSGVPYRTSRSTKEFHDCLFILFIHLFNRFIYFFVHKF
jgi:hypothetical protein